MLFADNVFIFIDSAFDLQFVILHKGLIPPSTFGEGVIMCFPGKTCHVLQRYSDVIAMIARN